GHADGHVVAHNVDTVDQAQVDDVEAQFGVDDVCERLEHRVLIQRRFHHQGYPPSSRRTARKAACRQLWCPAQAERSVTNITRGRREPIARGDIGHVRPLRTGGTMKAAKEADRGVRPPLSGRFPLAALAALALLAAMWAGLARMGWRLPVLHPDLAAHH